MERTVSMRWTLLILFIITPAYSRVYKATFAPFFWEKKSNLKIPLVPARPKQIRLSRKVKKYCRKIKQNFYSRGWGYVDCYNYPWHHVRNSVKGSPLIWGAFGREKANLDTTLVLCAVHGDEITPVKFCFDLMKSLRASPQIYENRLIVVAPIVNPDSYFKKRPTRTNARGVDINRNFPTRDWWQKALHLWRVRYKKNKRRYPGRRPLSEPEVLFQVNLIKRYRPNKIISVHAPLTMLDYDGPLTEGSRGILAKQLLIQMSKKANGYKISNYPHFPGSLGNYAGKERSIPTYTLELPTSDSRNSKKYWNLFKDAIFQAFQNDLRAQR